MKKTIYVSSPLLLFFILRSFVFAKTNGDNGCLSADIILLVDRSFSQSPIDYQYQMQHSLQNILFELPVNSNQVRVGIISFADSATVQSSITGDRDYLLEVIDSLYEVPIDTSGTSIQQSLGLTRSLFEQSARTRTHDVYRAIIILSDGEIPMWEYAVPILRHLERKYGVTVYSLGIGNDYLSDETLMKMASDSSYFGGNDVERIIAKLQELSTCP